MNNIHIGDTKMEFTKTEIEKTDRKVLLSELKNISSSIAPGAVARQTAEKIVMWLRLQDGKITQTQYDAYWANFKAA